MSLTPRPQPSSGLLPSHGWHVAVARRSLITGAAPPRQNLDENRDPPRRSRAGAGKGRQWSKATVHSGVPRVRQNTV